VTSLIYALILFVIALIVVLYLVHLMRRDRYRAKYPDYYKEKPSMLFNNQYKCKQAKNVSEATVLIEDGYEYVCEIDDVKLFKKHT
jgi:hypothetical protein